ncbi:CRISPR-associated endonuclease Cas2 [Sinimarinibacterium flocculans]|uniref:CRISPR-associated endoribonuclease Cas2 n=1 Tax=Sinimarinibacterium flocculans TaxID=985250 RepID=A0A318EKY7_9GAMM|nr:CRISPR-associated endonuclease Cas2 [Sinimarinibacterium flocculans]PXV71552.1 CRISPR-associated Cas2 family protein [Sinimarinibacterium flocculans]
MLTGYRLMWMLVMFDLPVVEDKERKAATAFRKALLDQGFEMAQFSVYLRHCTGPEQADTLTKRVESELPDGGKVDILYFTDKQYERIATFVGKKRASARKNPDQFNLF